MAILPVPLSPIGDALRRAEGRGAGRSESDVLAVSIASGYKFGSDEGEGFLPLLEEVVDLIPNLRFLVVGPGDRDRWREVARRTAGRIRSTGPINGLTAIYDSANIYLDSYPFSSLTSMLEAGQRGIPLVAYSDIGRDADVMAFDDPATDGLDVRVGSTAEYVAAIRRLVDDPGWRLERGRAIRDAIAVEHEGAGWRDRLEQAYAAARLMHAARGDATAAPLADPAPPSSLDLDRRLLALLDAQQGDAPAGVRGHVRFAPLVVRLEEWRRARRTDRPLSPLVLLPERAIMLGRRAAILARSVGRRVRRNPS